MIQALDVPCCLLFFSDAVKVYVTAVCCKWAVHCYNPMYLVLWDNIMPRCWQSTLFATISCTTHPQRTLTPQWAGKPTFVTMETNRKWWCENHLHTDRDDTRYWLIKEKRTLDFWQSILEFVKASMYFMGTWIFKLWMWWSQLERNKSKKRNQIYI